MSAYNSSLPSQQNSSAVAAQAAAVPRTPMQKLQRFIRLNILFIAIAIGITSYFIFHYVTFLEPIKYPLKHAVDALVPWLIFIMLFIAFSKVEIRKMKPRRWHFILIAFQVGIPFLLAYVVMLNPQSGFDVEVEGMIACIIVPTAAAASVITGKLGGDESSLTTYTILSNIGAAVSIPLIFPLISSAHMEFWSEFWIIMQRVFPMIVLPLFVAQFIRICFKPVNRFITTRLKEAGYYLWAFTLISVSATSCSNIMNSHESGRTLIVLAVIGLVATAVQFAFGKFIGHLEGQRISAGQGLGQKNMVFGIWVTYSYLSPAAAIAPGCYILWQNVVNSWQIWYRATRNLTYTDKM